MIDVAPRPRGVGPAGPQGLKGLGPKRKLYELDGLDGGVPAFKRRRTAAASATSAASPGTRLVDLQILGEDGALVQEATIEEVWTPHATRLEIVVVDDTWDAAVGLHAGEATLVDLDDPVLGPLGPLGGTSALHSAILREAQQQQHMAALGAFARLPEHPAAPSPGDKAGGGAEDSDFGNLDWLINFKVDSVFVEPKRQQRGGGRQAGASSPREAAAPGSAVADCGLGDVSAPGGSAGGSVAVSGAASPTGTARTTSPKLVPPAPPASSLAPAAPTATPAPPANPNPHPQAHRYSGPGKPPFTYTELIELALKDKGKLTVKEIYQWITKHFPFYQASDERWKNSVRHNLSINPHFRKESKAPQGAGHLWVVMDNNNKAKNSWKEERIQNFLAAQISAAAAEAASAASAAARTATTATEAMETGSTSPPSPERPPTPPSPVPTGAKSQSQLNTWWSERVSLERSAEEILSGVKREVGVEFLIPMDLDGDLDADDMKLDVKDERGFLYGDLTAEQVIAESGLQDELAGLYLLNDITMASSITADSLFPDDLNLSGLELPLSG